MTVEPQLPAAYGPLSMAVRSSLTELAPRDQLARIGALDARLRSVRPRSAPGALHVLRAALPRISPASTPPGNGIPDYCTCAAQLERAFLAGVRRDVGRIEPGHTAEAEMDALSIESVDGTGPSYWLRDNGTWEQMREYFVHRSLYHLKEGDPHAWAIPRLTGQAKASFVAVEFDEYGAGRGTAHSSAAVRRLVDRRGSGFDLPRLP